MQKIFTINDHYHARIKAPFGILGVRVEDERISQIVFLPRSMAPLAPQSKLAEKAVTQINRYLDDPEFRFKLPMKEVGTDFQRRVWGAISSIPSGRTLSYGAIARQIRTGPRAVGQACGANWFPLVIPCHRVVASGGLGGFGNQDNDEQGFHLSIKRWLLQHEATEADAKPRVRMTA